MRMGWLLGWAVPEAWFAPLVYRVFSDAEHTFVPGGPDALTRLGAIRSCDWIVGYSFGAQLLLSAAAQGMAWGRVALLAPVFAFPREEELGGRVARTQVRHLARWLRRDPPAALADFYARAGLDVPANLAPCAPIEDLLWGLERLENLRVEPPAPAGWRLWCGTDDPLLDAVRLRDIVPNTRLINGTHHPAALLGAMAEDVR